MSAKCTTSPRQCPICGKEFQFSWRNSKTKTCGNSCGQVLRQSRRTHEQRAISFWSHVDKSGGNDACWEWQIGKDENGYGTVRWEKRMQKAHRISYLLTHGDPGALHVLHKCDNPSCVNPAHLFLGTQLDNIEDRDRKGRSVQLRGEEQGQAKLTAAAVRAIRARYAAGGITKQALATEYQVSRTGIWRIVRRLAWKHIE